jgi:NAD(P)-dependent dehydrogenase (short-subunit alcohol dehydrogenase family)
MQSAGTNSTKDIAEHSEQNPAQHGLSNRFVKIALITGATDGIGLETARQLLRRGWHVLIHGRNEDKAARIAAALGREIEGSEATAVWGDLSDMAQVAELSGQVAARAPLLDVVINNAGVYERHRRLTVDGLEATLAVNHFAPFLLTRRLLPQLGAGPAGRIITVSSIAHQSGSLDVNDLTLARRYDAYAAYAASKLANVLFTFELAKRLAGTHITANALHPGVIGTKLLHAAFAIAGASVEAGARTSVYLATSEKVRGVSGKYFDDCREARPSALARDAELAGRLWAASERELARFM